MAEKKQPTVRESLISGGVVFVLFLWWMNSCVMSGDPKPAFDSKQSEATSYCQMYAKEKLKNPRSASFPWGDQARLLSGNHYILVSHIEAQNSFGATVRTEFSCEVEWVGGGYNGWKLIDFRIF